jgi:hypothetical protein
MHVRGCDFKSALAFVALAVGIELPPGNCRELRAQLERERRERTERERAIAQAEALERELRCAYRDEIQLYDRILRHVGRRLSALLGGDLENNKGDAEECWLTLSAANDVLRRANCAYSLLSFGNSGDRARFQSADAANREAMIDSIMNCGLIHDDEGRAIEVPL